MLPASNAWAQSVKKITIVGNKKIESAAIKRKLVSQVNQPYKTQNINKDIKSLFGMGYFNDVLIEKFSTGGGIELKYTILEKPSISKISYSGNGSLTADELQEATGLRPYQLLNYTKLNESIELIESAYEEEGYFLTEVNYEVLNETKQSAEIDFKINEGQKVKVKSIQFTGNSQIKSAELKKFMATREAGFFTGLSKSGAYKQEAFDQDIQRLNFYYLDKGYLKAKVEKPSVQMSPDRSGLAINIPVFEGIKYTVGDILFDGDLLYSESELEEAISTKPGEIFSYSKLQRDIQAITEKYGDQGFAYTNPIPRPRMNDETEIVDILFEIDKGQKVYIGNINVVGNTHTRDKVLRRELKLSEGDMYNETLKQKSLANVRRLGFFEDIKFQTKTPPGRDDIMDIDIRVKERNTGALQISAGTSAESSFVFGAQVSQSNFLGKGQRLGVQVDLSDDKQNINLSFNEPYWKDSQWGLGLNFYFKDRQLSSYQEKKLGLGFDLSRPIAENWRWQVGYDIFDTDLKLREEADTALFPVETANGLTSYINTAVSFDTRDDRIMTSKGTLWTAYTGYAGVGGDHRYIKVGSTLKHFIPITKKWILRNNLVYDRVISQEGDDIVPFNELFLLGGPYSLRGFDWYSVGTRRFSEKNRQALLKEDPTRDCAAPNASDRDKNFCNRPFGGEQKLVYNLELMFPLVEEAKMMGVFFYDIGYADDSLTLSDFRQNYGFGLRWFSPMGPLRFEFGFPINRDPEFGERANEFHFSFGTPF